jgi:CRP/FNR family cyclic AMP-dependent transcriptional regulator
VRGTYSSAAPDERRRGGHVSDLKRSPTPAAGLTGAATRLAEATIELRRGPWDPSADPPTGSGFAVLVLDGLLMREVHLRGAPAAQLVIPGETIDPFADSASVMCGDRVTWRVVEDTRLAVLGARFAGATQRVPALAVALCRRQLAQAGRAARHAAVAQLPRVEQRIVALLCVLAEERGRVVRDGVLVDLPLTHQAIGHLIGAKRPTVSLALKVLADDGLVRREGAEWLVSRAATALPAMPAAGVLAA